MDPVTAAAIISAGGAFIGGLFNRDATAQANRVQMDIARANMEQQNYYATHGIQMKMADARAAGVHPVYALGASGQSFSPVSVGVTPDFSVGDTISSMGQNISRAVASQKTTEEKALMDLQLMGAQADVQGKLINNQLMVDQLNRQRAVGPGIGAGTNFIPGQGNGPLVVDQPTKRTVSEPGRAGQEAGWHPSTSFARTESGMFPVIPQDLSEPMEDDWIGHMIWNLQNRIGPNFGGGVAPSAGQLPRGSKSWDWSYKKQEWQPSKYRDSYYDRMLKKSRYPY